MLNLSERQSRLIECIIREYLDTAGPVGSKILVEKYDLNVSPATVRNEMVSLAEEGFLDKEHFSAGRQPTYLAFRHFIQHLMEEEPLSVVDEVTYKQKIWEKRQDVRSLLKQSVYELAREVDQVSLVLTSDGEMLHSGAAFLLDQPEFFDIDLTRSVLRLLDEADIVRAIFEQLSEDQNLGVLLADEIGIESLNPCGVVYARIKPSQRLDGYLSVLGPMRLNYGRVIPRVRYFQRLINELGQSF